MSDHAHSADPEATPQSSSAAEVEHGDGHTEDIEEQIRVYLLVFGALAVLTALTVGVAYISLPFALAITVALVIATVKGGLVAGYFMHLISEKQVIYVLLLFTAVFVIAMLILMSSAITVHRGGVP